MNIQLEQMTQEDFAIFCEASVADYAGDLMKSGRLSKTQALMQAREEFASMLPQGAATAGHFLMTIRDAEKGVSVGSLWYFYEWTDGRKQVFLNDFVIFDQYRRRGYAAAALRQLEKNAKEDGCRESVLHVWWQNRPGMQLYAKCGYHPFRDTKDGVYMKKELL